MFANGLPRLCAEPRRFNREARRKYRMLIPMSRPTLPSHGKQLWDVLCKGAKILDEENGPSPRGTRVRATFTETALSNRCAGYREPGVESEFWVVASNGNGFSRTRVDFVKTGSGKLVASCEVNIMCSGSWKSRTVLLVLSKGYLLCNSGCALIFRRSIFGRSLEPQLLMRTGRSG